MSVNLDPFGGPVPIGSVILRTPGLTGSAEAHLPASPAMRNSELSTEELQDALRSEHVEAQETIELVDTREIEIGAVPSRSTVHAEPAIELEVADPGDAFGQVVLYVDEAGVATWNFARDQNLELDVTRGGATRTYVLRRSVAETPGAAETRGLIGAVGKKLLKVLVFPIVDPLIGEVGNYFAHRWERRKRPYRLRSFSPDDFSNVDAAELDTAAWSKLGQGRALLLVHGTFSRAHTAFGSFPRVFVEELHRLYEGRVFAFDHFTLSEDPRENVEWLVRHLPEGASLELDILAHSRGGLVGRVLAEKQSELSLGSRIVTTRKLVLVATPNAGTVLTDTKYLGDLIDTYTNLLNFFPDIGVIEVLEGVITVMKQLAVGALGGLDGLQSMLPEGLFLKEWLNTSSRDDKQYFAIASDYEPISGGLSTFRNVLTDRIFRNEQNDLVVPTAGVYDRNGSKLFPIEERHVFASGEGVAHTQFFANAIAQQRLLAWLDSE